MQGIRFSKPLPLADGEFVVVDAREARYLSVLTNPTVPAVGTLVVGGIADGNTVTIGSTVFTFESGALNVVGEVDLGATVEDSLDNLIKAINGTGVAGTDYVAGTEDNPLVTAVRGPDAAAFGTLTGTTIANGNTVTIGSNVYTFQTVLTNVAGNVAVGASDSDSLDNLIAAINGDAGGGTLYAEDTVAHPDVTAAAGAADTMDVFAAVAGANGNAIATTATLSAGDFGAATLTGGTSSMDVTSIAFGTDSNDIATTDTLAIGAWGDVTLTDATDPTVLYSVVLDEEATEHGSPTESVTGDNNLETIDVAWPYYGISVTGGDVYYALSAF